MPPLGLITQYAAMQCDAVNSFIGLIPVGYFKNSSNRAGMLSLEVLQFACDRIMV